MSKPKEADVLERMRGICLRLPGTEQIVSHGHPAFRAFGRIYAVLEEYRRELSLCVNVGKPVQDIFLKDPRFYRTPYVGRLGWVSLRVHAAPLDWSEIRELLAGSYQLAAPPKRAHSAPEQARNSGMAAPRRWRQSQ